ncbi:MAG: T9SS type A sorting domain-containing protein [Prolixibacteraceae bacterium]|nr:T9SS type A sorting domain-containing protein [Prolixibacteraceae bacterium]
MMNSLFRIFSFVTVFCFFAITVNAQTKAFPGAEGHGAYTTGGRGGDVYEVTNLNDSGEGSLRAAIDASGPRTVVFRISGTIELQSELRIRNDDITIAGQTAPGDGICLKNFSLRIAADNVIIRFIRSRMGDEKGSESDAMWGREQKDIIIDHCSMSWSVDETGSFYDNENFTMQWCILSESLYKSVHSKGNHGYGGIWGGMKASFHHNLLAHHSSRNPRFNGSRYHGQPAKEIVDFRNNVVYNWGGNSAYGGEQGNQNMVNNYYKAGPATSSSKRNRIINPSDASNADPMSQWYVEGNYVDGYPEVTADNWNGGVQPGNNIPLDQLRADEPFPTGDIETETATEAFESVLVNAGANVPKRDDIDKRIVSETLNGTTRYGGSYGEGKGIIDSPDEVGGWVVLASTEPPADTDHDGMPDEWEDDNGLDKGDDSDRNLVNDDGYTNLEVYLNSLVGIEEPVAVKQQVAFAEKVKVYPNPASGNVNVQFKTEKSTDAQIVVIDMSGRVRKRLSCLTESRGSNVEMIDLTGIQSGIYIVSIQSGNHVVNEKLRVVN